MSGSRDGQRPCGAELLWKPIPGCTPVSMRCPLPGTPSWGDTGTKRRVARGFARPSALSFSFGVARIRFSGAVRYAPRVWGAGFAAYWSRSSGHVL